MEVRYLTIVVVCHIGLGFGSLLTYAKRLKCALEALKNAMKIVSSIVVYRNLNVSLVWKVW